MSLEKNSVLRYCHECGESEVECDLQSCAGCSQWFCPECIDWCAPEYDPPNGDYFCEQCRKAAPEYSPAERLNW